MDLGPTSPTKPSWKGKSRAVNQEFVDLNPTITYRHILSQNLGVKDPLRVVALCDSDAFYAACEMNRLQVPPDTPLVVLQWESLIAVNYPARKYGISRMDKKKDALKRCPHLKVVHVATYKEGEAEPGYWDDVDTNTHKVSLDYYRRESMKIAALFREMLPGCEVEKASIDEAFIDFTKPVRDILLERYPYLATVPADAPYGIDSPLPPPPPVDWEGKGTVVPVHPPPPPPDPKPSSKEEDSEREGETEPQSPGASTSTTPLPTLDTDLHGEEDDTTTWHDVALSIASELMFKARQEVLKQLNYSTSAGVARNKFLAKLAASYRKPDGQSILRNAAIPNYLIPMPFQKIRFLGGKLGKAFAEQYDVSTVGDLLTISLDEMQSKFGEESVWVYEILRGIDRSEVKDKGTTLTKSMLASKNLPKPITKASEGYHWIRVLAAELALRLNDARKLSPNLWPKTIVLHARKGYEPGRSKQAPFPFTKDVTVDFIAAAGGKLWKELVGNTSTMKVSSVQLAFTGIGVSEAGQQTIEGFFGSKPPSKRSRDDVKEHPGEARAQEGIDRPAEVSKEDVDNQMEDPQARSRSGTDELSYTCPRCQKTIRPNAASSTTVQTEEECETVLTGLRLEHDDWHFAQDLVREEATSSGKRIIPGQTTQGSKPKKRRKETKGIEKFFTRK
ncbi:hypothetical protein D9611_001599 [Ephemerocybe angulata]|uniref:DNA polymerase eta n=1 Tax=Ephemerocybe angulata TaxID=980116 RepID=A0A8H5CHX4_9AGAR|nr:hypothetical protein D9611_001599 [Tulosesus angulatus]